MRGREGVVNKMLETIEQMTPGDAADSIGSVLATSFQACFPDDTPSLDTYVVLDRRRNLC